MKKIKYNSIEKFAGVFSKNWKVKLAVSRNYKQILQESSWHQRKYEAASRSPRTAGWLTISSNANTEISAGGRIMRNRARDLLRNNARAKSIENVYTNNIAGTGIKLKFLAKDNLALQDDINAHWKRWADSVFCDYDSDKDFYGLQRLAVSSLLTAGEFLIKKNIEPRLLDNMGRELVPLRLQMLEADHFDDRQRNLQNSENTVILGIEKNARDQVVAYYLFENHPGDSLDFLKTAQSKRMAANKFIHCFVKDRPGAVRGVSLLAPVIIPLKDLDDFEDAELVRQKVSALFTAFVRDIGLDGVDDLTGAQERFGSTIGEKLEPGTIEFLPEGKTIEFSRPPQTANNKEFINSQLHKIAAAMGISFAQLTGDLSQTNFSSARGGKTEVDKNFKKIQSGVFKNKFLDPIVNEWLSVFKLTLGSRYSQSDLENLTWTWTPPNLGTLDPQKEIKSCIEAINSGLKSYTEVLQEFGKDPEQHFQQIAAERELMQSLGLDFSEKSAEQEEPRAEPNSNN